MRGQNRTDVLRGKDLISVTRIHFADGELCRLPLTARPDHPSTTGIVMSVRLMIGAAHFWLVRKGFYFTAAGCELPIVWTILLLVQALLGDGPYALKPSPLPGISSRQRVPA
jgi:hypothetical protein